MTLLIVVMHTYVCICMYNAVMHLFVGNEHPCLKDLCGYVTPLYAAEWREIGVGLGLSDPDLKVIRADHPTSTRDCCNNMFRFWLQVDPAASWEKVFNAIDSLAMSSGTYLRTYVHTAITY